MEHNRGRQMASRTVLVTGATSGIGRAIALGLATTHVAMAGRANSQSKLADVLFSHQLASRLRESVDLVGLIAVPRV